MKTQLDSLKKQHDNYCMLTDEAFGMMYVAKLHDVVELLYSLKDMAAESGEDKDYIEGYVEAIETLINYYKVDTKALSKQAKLSTIH